MRKSQIAGTYEKTDFIAHLKHNLHMFVNFYLSRLKNQGVLLKIFFLHKFQIAENFQKILDIAHLQQILHMYTNF